jgi:hypothetical protein
MPTVLPISSPPRWKIPYAHRPMSSAAIPGSLLYAPLRAGSPYDRNYVFVSHMNPPWSGFPSG